MTRARVSERRRTSPRTHLRGADGAVSGGHLVRQRPQVGVHPVVERLSCLARRVEGLGQRVEDLVARREDSLALDLRVRLLARRWARVAGAVEGLEEAWPQLLQRALGRTTEAIRLFVLIKRLVGAERVCMVPQGRGQSARRSDRKAHNAKFTTTPPSRLMAITHTTNPKACTPDSAHAFCAAI